MTDKSERRKALEQTLKNINKELGKDFFGFADEAPEAEVIPFGIEALDKFYGGGVPRRKFTVDFGSEDTGKSSRALHLVANAQKQGLIACYIDLERKFDKTRAEQLGVNLEELVLNQVAKTAEEAMDAIRTLAQDKVVDLIIVDSIQAMSPKAEQESKKGVQRSIEENEMALLAQKLGKFFRIVSPDIFRANIAVYLIGQVRMNIGGFFAFADLSGGNALKHWMSFCSFSRKGQKADAPTIKQEVPVETPDGTIMKKKDIAIGFDCVMKVEKSHIAGSAKENQEIHLPFYYDTGFNEPSLAETNPHATDKEALKQAVISSTAVEGVKIALEDLQDKPKSKRGRKAGSKNKEKK
jgi:protein RecA